KITEPSGAKAFVTVGGETKEDVLPAVFNLPDSDAYVAVRVVAADGDSWSGKGEIKARKQTVLKLADTAKAAAKSSSGKLIGQIPNWTHLCTPRERETLRFVAMKDGQAVYETTLRPNQGQSNVELEAGHYSVRTFRGGTFMKAKDLDVTKT